MLQDYRRQGKRFIPPMLQIPGITPSDWLKERVPELIWIALLIHVYGIPEGVDVAVRVAKAAAKCHGNPERAFAAISDYAKLSENEKHCVRFMLRSEDVLDKVRLGLAALIDHYPEFPLGFLVEPGKENNDIQRSTLHTLRKTLRYIRDREHVASAFAQAGVICIFSANRKPGVPPNCGIDNFSAIVDYPMTEESKRVASAIGVTVTVFLTEDITSDWRNYFWDLGRMMSPCRMD